MKNANVFADVDLPLIDAYGKLLSGGKDGLQKLRDLGCHFSAASFATVVARAMGSEKHERGESMKTLVAVVAISVLALTAPALSAADVAVVALSGNTGTNFKSNIDLSGAVGSQYAVSFNGGGFVAQDKANGKVVERLSQRDFWIKKVEASYTMDPDGKFNDPKLIYDPLSQRWFATVAPHNITYLAVSASPDPTKAWKGVILPFPTIDPGPMPGVDRNGLYVCAIGV